MEPNYYGHHKEQEENQNLGGLTSPNHTATLRGSALPSQGGLGRRRPPRLAKPLEHPARPEHPDRDPAALGVEGEQFAEGGDLEVTRGRLRAVRHLLGCVVLVDLRLCILSGCRNRPLLMIAVPGRKIWLYLATKYLLE